MREESRGRAEGHPWEQRCHIALPIELSTLPPEDYEQHGRQRGSHSLTHECQREKSQSQQILRALARSVKVQIREYRGEIEDRGERTFLFRDPRYRFDTHRVQGKDEARQPRARQSKALDDSDHQACRQRVQRDIDQMIAQADAPRQAQTVSPDRHRHPSPLIAIEDIMAIASVERLARQSSSVARWSKTRPVDYDSVTYERFQLQNTV
jgi:hypothetical protein